MPITIGRNLDSLQAQRRLNDASSSLSKSYERLSSGARINSAADDAAGLALAEDLRTKTRVYTQAIRNGSDGQSVLAIADSAVESLTTIVTRIRELAEQAANGSYSNTQREALDDEAQALAEEYFRIGRTTTYNGINLFDGSLSDGLRLQLGYGLDGSIRTSIGGKVGTGSISQTTQLATEGNWSLAVRFADLNGDGTLDMVTAGADGGIDGYATVRLGIGSGNFGSATSYATEGFESVDLELGDLNGDGILDLVTGGATEGFDGYATVRLGVGDGTFGGATSFATENAVSRDVELGDLNGDGHLDLVTTGWTDANDGYATVRLGTGNGSFGSATYYAAETYSSEDLELGDLNGDGIIDMVTAGLADTNDGYATVRLGNGDGTFGSATSYAAETLITNALSLGDLDGDGVLDLVTAGRSDSQDGYATVRLGNGAGGFGAATSFATESLQSWGSELGDLNGDGILDLVTSGEDDSTNGYATLRLGTGNGSFGAAVSFTTESQASYTITIADINADGVSDVVSGGRSDGNDGYATLFLGSTRDGVSPLQPFSLRTKADSLQAIGSLAIAFTNLSTQRGVIGAYQSRVGIAINTLTSVRENFSAAESRISDADMAEETANLVRSQILQQAATAILAQANQTPALALELLR